MTRPVWIPFGSGRCFLFLCLLVGASISCPAQEPTTAASSAPIEAVSPATAVVDSVTFERPEFVQDAERAYTTFIESLGEQIARVPLGDWVVALFAVRIVGNYLYVWLLVLVLIFSFYSLLRYVRSFVCRRVKRHVESRRTAFGDSLLECVRRTHPAVLFVAALFLATQFLKLPNKAYWFFWILLQVALVVQVAIWASYFFRSWVYQYLARKSRKDQSSLDALGIINFLLQVLIWSTAFIAILGSIGVDVTALVTGLGIGGVAVALALQNILGDLLASLAILFDKPFVKDDFIIFEDKFMGNVEYIGIKTTRIRSLSGEQLICPNADLIGTRIRNYKRMKERRIVFQIGVTYNTPLEKVREIPSALRRIVTSLETTRFDRAHFATFGDSALIFEVVYFVLSPDYLLYMDTQQTINLSIMEYFQQAGIEFAFPTQTVYLESGASRLSEAESVASPRPYE